MREVVFGRRKGHRQRFFQITTDPVRQPPETTWYIVSNLPGKIDDETVGDVYGWRTWIEYGLKQAKDELGWADYRVTDYHAIERWWELVMSVATLVARQTRVRPSPQSPQRPRQRPRPLQTRCSWPTHNGTVALAGSVPSTTSASCSSPTSVPASSCHGSACARCRTCKLASLTCAPS
ncbi:MAG TPA: hypothetical protein VGF38_22675 [Ktedonobacterales bacterium]|jgi:hypothetical protein